MISFCQRFVIYALSRCALMQTLRALCESASASERDVRASVRAAAWRRSSVRPRGERRPAAGLAQLGLHLSHNPSLQVPTE